MVVRALDGVSWVPHPILIVRYTEVAFWTSLVRNTSILREALRLCFVGGGRGRVEE